MDANSIVQSLGSLLMSPEEERILGRNQSLYAEPIDKVFNPHRKEWMHNHFAKYAKRHSGCMKFPFDAYASVLKTKAKKFFEIYEIDCDGADRCEAVASLIRQQGKTTTGYVQWVPTVRVIVESRRDGTGALSIVFEGRTYAFSETPDDFGESLERLCTLPEGCDKGIIRSCFAEFLPDDMKKRYAHVTISEDMGRSCNGGGDFTFGHEVELRTMRGYRLRYAYVAEYMWVEGAYDKIHETVRTAEEGMKAIARKAPGLSIVTNHGDDCGTHLYWTLPDNLTRLMEKIEAWSGGEQVTLDTVREVLDYYKLSHKQVPPQDVLNDYTKGTKWRKIKIAEVGANLKPKEHGWKMYPHWDSLRLYITGERGWAREAYIDIPYDCPAKVYMKLLDATEEISALSRSLLASGDHFTSVGLFAR